MDTDYPNIRENGLEYIEKKFSFIVPHHQTPERIDLYLTQSIRNVTRTKVQLAIESGNVKINGKVVKPSRKVQPGDIIECKILKLPPIKLVPEDIPLEILFEDEFLIVINKPAGMVTHPGFGNRQGTLVNAVLYHMGERQPIEVEQFDEEEEQNEGVIYSSDEIRPGIVHRLDKDTSGLIVIAKNPSIHFELQKQFHDRTINRFYNALVWGVIEEDKGTITGDIGRSSLNRKLFAVVKKDGKPAITDFEVLERFEFATLLQVKLRTGRTHQIRVHLSHNRHPIFGDPSYGGDKIVYKQNFSELKRKAEIALSKINRQMLHARTLGFKHPVRNIYMQFDSELPEDMKNCIELLKI